MSITGNLKLISGDGPFWNEVLDLDLKAFPHPWASSDWRSLDFSHHTLFVSVNGKNLQGFSLFRTLAGDETAHLLKICIAPTMRGKGYSGFFWTQIVKELKDKGFSKVYLEVESTNKGAIGFYRKSGFQDLRVIKSFYSSGGDALTMQLTL